MSVTEADQYPIIFNGKMSTSNLEVCTVEYRTQPVRSIDLSINQFVQVVFAYFAYETLEKWRVLVTQLKETSLTEKTTLEASAEIIDSLKTAILESYGDTEEVSLLFICHDERWQVHAIGLGTPYAGRLVNHVTSLVIRYLATNPINLRIPANNMKPGRVRGAGTAIISLAAKYCLGKKVGQIVLAALENSIGFYDQLGFEEYNLLFTMYNRCLKGNSLKAMGALIS